MRHFIDLVESAHFNDAFRAWFGNSQVVDARGRPLMVFHGTKGDIQRFDLRGRSRSGGKAYFFTPDPVFAHLYANRGGEEGGRIYPVYLRITNMFDNGDPDHVAKLEATVEKWLANEKARADAKGQYSYRTFYPFTKDEIFTRIRDGRWDALEHPIVIDCLKKAGFDGATVSEGTNWNFMVFSPTQVKSVFNSGAWSPNDPAIVQ